MKDSNKEKFVALVSRKEAMNHIHNSDQGEASNDENIIEKVSSVAPIVKLYEERRSN